MLQWRYAYLLHFFDMIWYGICMLWYAISMLCYEIFKNDMVCYRMVCYAMYAILRDLSKRSFFHRRFPLIFLFLYSDLQVLFLYKSTLVIVLHVKRLCSP